MHLIQILLPVYDNHGKAFPREHYERVKAELSARFSGLTAYVHSPAEGIWTKGKATQREDIVVFEVMAPKVDRKWWRHYRADLEQRFRQETVVIRRQSITLL
ncbi:MAG TPA: hypothetical protein VG754_07180 [Verrucomicrobiae bacterium]|jgi:hypothetical protein|nr:hypothetical protein [Verrucomicrobiae bacterium]